MRDLLAQQLVRPVGWSALNVFSIGCSIWSPIWLLSGLLVGASGCRAISGPEKDIDGDKSFVRHCARCHGADGKGVAKMQPIPDFSDSAWQNARTDAQIRRTIQMGIAPRMPAYGRRFMEPTQASLVGAIRRLARVRAAPSKVEK